MNLDKTFLGVLRNIFQISCESKITSKDKSKKHPLQDCN